MLSLNILTKFYKQNSPKIGLYLFVGWIIFLPSMTYGGQASDGTLHFAYFNEDANGNRYAGFGQSVTDPNHGQFTTSDTNPASNGMFTHWAAGELEIWDVATSSFAKNGAVSLSPNSILLKAVCGYCWTYVYNSTLTSNIPIEAEYANWNHPTIVAACDNIDAPNEPPVITSAASVTAQENQTSVDTVTYTDSNNSDTITFSITGGTDASSFSITSSGVLTFITSPNFESQSSYSLSVTADDGNGGTDSQSISVSISNVNEVPSITGGNITGTVASGSVLTAIGTFSDPDSTDNSSNGTISYQWHTGTSNSCSSKTNISGATNSTFTLNPDQSGKYICVTITPKDDENLVGSPVTKTTSTSLAKIDTIATAVDKTRTYGNSNPAATYNYTNGGSGINSPPTATFPAVTENIGTYSITCSGGTDDKYDITSCNSGTLTINQKSISVAADDKAKVYGETNPTLTKTYTGLANGETELSTPPILATIADITTGVGTVSITCTGGSGSNYSLSSACADGTLTITKKTIAVTIDNNTKIYGEDNPTFTANYSGFVNDDTVMSPPPNLVTIADNSSVVGNYAITCSGDSDPNYFPDCTNGTLDITKKAIIASVDAKTRTYGTDNPTFTVTYNTLIAGDIAMSTPPTLTTSAIITSAVGDHDITCSINTDDNYNLTSCSDGILTIVKADTITTINSDNADPSVVTQSITIDVSVDSITSGIPTGTVTINDGNGNTCDVTLTTGTGNCDLVPANGDTTLTATYNGDESFNSSFATEAHASLVAAIKIDDGDGVNVAEELETTDIYTLAAVTVPTSAITVTITADDQIQISTDTINFAETKTIIIDDLTIYTITVKAIDDSDFEINQTTQITHAITTGDGGDYSTSLNISAVDVSISDNDPGVIITSTNGKIAEDGATKIFEMVLNTQPTDDVTIIISTDNQTTVDSKNLIFNSDNWDQIQTAIVMAVDDESIEGIHKSTINFNTSSNDSDYNEAIFIIDDTEATNLLIAINDNDSVTVTYNLAITKTGNGIITTDYGINCGNDCENEFADQAEISLTVTPDIGWIFDSWTGDCDENGEVRINKDKTCTAVFLQEHTLSINVEGQGIVDNCGTSCTQTHLAGEIINLTTTTEGIWALDNWNGDCDEAGKVIMDSDKTCVATFVEGYPLVITISNGKGIVKTETKECAENCEEIVSANSITSLIVEPEIEWVFDSWSGDCDVNGEVEMTKKKTCTVNFIKDPNIPNNGDGNGDGIHDADQPNVVSMPDQNSGNYLTLDIKGNVTLKEIYTDLAENQDYFEEKYIFPQGLLYFELEGTEANITIYYHSLQKLRATPIFQKFGTKVPGDMSTLGWFVLPNVIFDTVKVGEKSVVTVTYQLKDGELGDSTGTSKPPAVW